MTLKEKLGNIKATTKIKAKGAWEFYRDIPKKFDEKAYESTSKNWAVAYRLGGAAYVVGEGVGYGALGCIITGSLWGAISGVPVLFARFYHGGLSEKTKSDLESCIACH
ncbi:MAG: hypothetical protein JSW73_03800 [Candidatus Woesearchaeota archaeon]|nr:MAG: hypothetical protein JSW73_03800 [Candidatus Woesearchaeota archaeon]